MQKTVLLRTARILRKVLDIQGYLENEDYKILRHFSIQTDRAIEAQRPDLVVVDKKERSCKIVDLQFLEIVGLRRKNIKTWERSCRRYGMLK